MSARALFPLSEVQPMQAAAARRLVNGYTTGMTDEQKDATVARMVETGECVWHAAATVCGKPCWCAGCRPDIRRFS